VPGAGIQAQLRYYSWTEGTSDKTLKGGMLLRGAFVNEVESETSKRHNFRFRLTGHSADLQPGATTTRELLMNAENADERRAWVTALRAAITAANVGASSSMDGGETTAAGGAGGSTIGGRRPPQQEQRRQRVASLIEESSSARFEAPSFTVSTYLQLSEPELARILSSDQVRLLQKQRKI
jgi:hypothetical protein